MKRAGFFTEIVGAPPGAPSVLDVAGYAPDDRVRLAAYLAAGHPVLHVPDVVLDPLRPDRIAGSSTVLTDGEWPWSQAVAHFLRVHGVTVPADLVTRARANRWSVPDLPAERLSVIGDRHAAITWVLQEFSDDPVAPPEGGAA